MRKWIVASALLHILICILLWLGLPQFAKPLPEPPAIIPIEIAELAPIATAKNIERQEDPKPEPPKPAVKPEPPKPPEPKPEPPKPEPPKPQPAPPTPEPKPPTPEPKPPELKPEAIIPAPTQKPKPPETKKAEPKADPLSSILKNVAKLKNEPKPDIKKPSEKLADKPLPPATPAAEPQKEPKPATSAPSAPNMADKLSMSEEDALRRQISGCWNVPVGAKDIENISVEIYIQVNPDRTLKDAIVVDQSRMGRDPFFRAVAESALRALRNPRCSPLALPPEKYQQWQETIFNFNPKDML